MFSKSNHQNQSQSQQPQSVPVAMAVAVDERSATPGISESKNVRVVRPNITLTMTDKQREQEKARRRQANISMMARDCLEEDDDADAAVRALEARLAYMNSPVQQANKRLSVKNMKTTSRKGVSNVTSPSAPPSGNYNIIGTRNGTLQTPRSSMASTESFDRDTASFYSGTSRDSSATISSNGSTSSYARVKAITGFQLFSKFIGKTMAKIRRPSGVFASDDSSQTSHGSSTTNASSRQSYFQSSPQRPHQQHETNANVKIIINDAVVVNENPMVRITRSQSSTVRPVVAVATSTSTGGVVRTMPPRSISTSTAMNMVATGERGNGEPHQQQRGERTGRARRRASDTSVTQQCHRNVSPTRLQTRRSMVQLSPQQQQSQQQHNRPQIRI